MRDFPQSRPAHQDIVLTQSGVLTWRACHGSCCFHAPDDVTRPLMPMYTSFNNSAGGVAVITRSQQISSPPKPLKSDYLDCISVSLTQLDGLFIANDKTRAQLGLTLTSFNKTSVACMHSYRMCANAAGMLAYRVVWTLTS